ncbi:MAG TPA: Tm-1-like ATP-binding domain-containing protein [Arthrobacter sp.]|nr:Tm-1-like ATP-binding domain-containing protein [Arthrobacter sp.]
MRGCVALIVALDTKGEDGAFVRSRLEAGGFTVTLIDVGVQGTPTIPSDISRAEVARAAGEDVLDIAARGDRGKAVNVMAQGAAQVLSALAQEGRADAVMAMGGSAGTTIGTTAMRRLPFGIPKLMVSTVASGDTRPYVGHADIVMVPSVADVAGLNRISRVVYAHAVDALSGMLAGKASDQSLPTKTSKPVVGATMFGVTTACVSRAQVGLQESGCEVVAFHATGVGGNAMEQLIQDGLIDAALDLTTTEWADELVGGILSAGPHRLEAAGRVGLPQVVSVGALDMVNLGPISEIPVEFRERNLHVHNAHNTLMRTTAEESRELGRIIATKLNQASGPAALVLPLRGISALDHPGQPFYDNEAREALFAALRATLDTEKVHLRELDLHINDAEFADSCVAMLLSMLEGAKFDCPGKPSHLPTLKEI